MKDSDPTGQVSDQVRINHSLLKTALPCRSVWQAVHLHRPFNPFTITFKVNSSERYRHDANINIRSQTAVQSHFLVALVSPLLKRAEVKKSVVDRLLNFADVISSEKHGGNMGLPNLDILHRKRKAGRLGK